jgi:hypothetical protein
LATPKPAKEKELPYDIKLCINVRFFKYKIVNIIESNFLLLRNIIDKMGKFNCISVIDLANNYY